MYTSAESKKNIYIHLHQMMKIEVESNYFCFQKLTRYKVEYKCILLKANINLRKKALLVEH